MAVPPRDEVLLGRFLASRKEEPDAEQHEGAENDDDEIERPKAVLGRRDSDGS